MSNQSDALDLHDLAHQEVQMGKIKATARIHRTLYAASACARLMSLSRTDLVEMSDWMHNGLCAAIDELIDAATGELEALDKRLIQQGHT